MKIPLAFLGKGINKHLYTFLLSLMLGCFTLSAQGQNIVTGTVTSSVDGEPIIGAGVIIKGKNIGSTTDINGAYSISVNSGETLVFSSVGHLSQEINVGSQKTIDVILQEDLGLLDELVVVGYGVQKKKLSTGATIQVKGDELSRMNTTSPLQAMQGKVPGVNISSTSGQPGSGMKVVVRGLGTIGNSGPLYIIDGIEGDISIYVCSEDFLE